MRKIIAVLCCLFIVSACDKHDPILPGTRTAIFDSADVKVSHERIVDIPDSVYSMDNSNCPYTQDSENVIWDGARRVFSGFATKNTVSADMRPVCDGGFVYAGLTTGELIKINPKTRQISWIADIYRPSNMTGGASMVDIIAPIVVTKDSVYAGGLGDAFCRIAKSSGNKSWCINIGVAHPFIITDNYAFVVATDDNLYAIRLKDGVAMWRTSVSDPAMPEYNNGVIVVGSDKIDVSGGKIIK